MLDKVIGGRYKVVAKLGEGGMGAVYEARHTETSRRVAIKVISADGSRSPTSLVRFETEAKSAGQLESQYIAQVLDAGRDDDLAMPFLVMEFLNGDDLAQTFARIAPLEPDLVLRIVAQACMGLDKAHAAGIVHRDIKPANMLLAERDGTERVLKILDFGIAKLLTDGQKGPTRTGALIGSPMYMSPEQARGAGGVDSRSDLWSLGVVMYEALVGKTPYHGIEGIGDLLMAICTQEPPSVREAAPWVSEEVAAIVSRALTIDGSARFQSAGEMLKAVKALLPMGTQIDADMLVAADQSRRPTVGPTVSADTARDAAWSAVQPRANRTAGSPGVAIAAATGNAAGPASAAAAAAAPNPFEGPTLLSPQQPSGPLPIPTLASETDSARARAIAVPSVQPVTYGSAPPEYGRGPAVPSQNWYPPSAGAAAPGWVPQHAPPAQIQVGVSKSRVALYFGCGVAACLMGIIVLLLVLVALDESESESESNPAPAQATTRRPAPK